jgi:hypothetical protein
MLKGVQDMASRSKSHLGEMNQMKRHLSQCYIDALAPTAHRWTHVVIESVDKTFKSLALERLDLLMFPSLTHITVGHIPRMLCGKSAVYRPRFLEAERSSNLRSLELAGELLSSKTFWAPYNLAAVIASLTGLVAAARR